jgi:PAS domain S-box-containing protein
LGYPRTDLIGKNDYDLFPKRQADFFTANDRKVLSGHEIVDIPEEPISTCKGERILHTKKIPVFGQNGEPEYLLGIAEDITERKRAEQERLRMAREQAAAEERERASREFLTIASHELKTPVTSLKLQLQMAARNLSLTGQAPSIEKLKKTFESSVQQVDRLTRLIEDLLDVSRIQSGKISFHLDHVDISTLLSDVLVRYQEPLEAAGCRLRTFIQPEVSAFVDRGRIEQVLVNLISNVLKYAAGAPLMVQLKTAGDNVCIEVIDNGPGIETHEQKRIFERFGRVAKGRHITGLGLGLFISQQIVEAHGGQILVESEPGHGAKFVILLPLKISGPALVDKFTYTAEPLSN